MILTDGSADFMQAYPDIVTGISDGQVIQIYLPGIVLAVGQQPGGKLCESTLLHRLGKFKTIFTKNNPPAMPTGCFNLLNNFL
jgi:hypothetical protein